MDALIATIRRLSVGFGIDSVDLLLAAMVLLCIFPEVALWLPTAMMGVAQ